MEDPSKLIQPEQINTLSSYLNGFITDGELELWEKQLLASNKEVELLSSDITNAKAKALWRVSPEYAEWKKTERLVRQLKRFRQDLKDRMSILMSGRRY